MDGWMDGRHYCLLACLFVRSFVSLRVGRGLLAFSLLLLLFFESLLLGKSRMFELVYLAKKNKQSTAATTTMMFYIFYRSSWLVSVTILLCFISSSSSALPSPKSEIWKRATASSSSPIPPSKDRFYTAPPDFANSPPGTVLRLRSAPSNLTSIVGNCSAAYNLLYRTTDSRYNASWAVTTLFIPFSNTTATNNHSALLSYQIPYDSADVNASPSYALYSSPPSDISKALSKGWYVSVPDYEGPLARSLQVYSRDTRRLIRFEQCSTLDLGCPHLFDMPCGGIPGERLPANGQLNSKSNMRQS